MAVNSEIVDVLVEAISALNLRVDEVFSQQAIQQAVIEANARTDQKLDAIVGNQIKEAAENWLRDNIAQPQDGKDGVDGRTPTEAEIKLAVNLWFQLNQESLRGTDGIDGKDGRDGKDGKDGRSGIDGKNGKDGKDGRAGVDGTDGVGIALIEQRDEKSFFITLTTGEEFQIDLPTSKASGFFGGNNGGGGGGAGATVLNDLTDVVINDVLDLDVLQYDAASMVWRNTSGVYDGGTFN